MVGTPFPTGDVRLEPEVQKLAVTALIGLMFLFPVFNQVQATSLDALKDADHKAKFKDLIKDWDDIPEDEKLAYWDGRNKPPGDGDFDRSDIDDDARIHQPQPGEPTEGDRDGDGVPDERDPDPDDAQVTDEMRKVWHEVVLWQFVGSAGALRETRPLPPPGGVSTYEHLNVTWDYDGFTGTAEFDLKESGATLWSHDINSGQGIYAIGASDRDDETHDGVPANGLEIAYDYDGLAQPNRFNVTITGAYVEYEPVRVGE